MVKDKGVAPSQQVKIDKFAVVGARARPQEGVTPPEEIEPDRFAETLSAIQASRQALEGEIGGSTDRGLASKTRFTECDGSSHRSGG